MKVKTFVEDLNKRISEVILNEDHLKMQQVYYNQLDN
jgi:hypothetical protein